MNPAMIKQFLNSDLAQPLDAHVTEKADALTALLGTANPASGGTDNVMNFIKLVYNQLGQDDPVTADRTSITNYLKLLETNISTVDTVVDSILAQLGIDNPTTADQTTIMNFLKQIKDNMPAKGLAGNKLNVVRSQITATTEVTVATYTGGGELVGIIQCLSAEAASSAGNSGLKIIVDSSTRYDSASVGTLELFYGGAIAVNFLAAPIRFNSNFTINHKMSNNNVTLTTIVLYVTD